MDDMSAEQRVIQLQAALLAHELRIQELEYMLRHFDRASMHLLHYVKAIDGLPKADEWQLVREQIDDMVDPYGPRNPNGRS